MPITALRVRKNGVAFYLNTETSSPGTSGNRTRYRLFKTAEHGKVKCGYVQIGSIAGQALLDIVDEAVRFDGCEAGFAGKKPYLYHRPETIRGRPSPWECEAFPERRPVVAGSRDTQEPTHQERGRCAT